MASLFVFGVANTNAARSVEIDDPRAAGYGAEVLVKDDGNQAGTNNITITPVAGFIDGMSSVVIDSNGGALRLRSDGVEWRKIATNGGGGGSTFPPATGNIVIAAGGAGGIVLDTTGGTDATADEIQITAHAPVLIAANEGNSSVSMDDAVAITGTTTVALQSGAVMSLKTTGNTNKHLDMRTQGTSSDVVIESEQAKVRVTAAVALDLICAGGDVGLGAQPTTGTVNLGYDIQTGDISKIAEFGGTGSGAGAPIANASGGAVIDAEARTAINALLAYFRTRGTLNT